MQVGKKGVTEETIKEAAEQIEKRGLVKVRFNNDGTGIDALTGRLSEKAELIMKTGKTLVFSKRR
ncbi:MAG: YhbY family RNA-binding protein [Thermoplasmata archaeon]|nr:YhbY family RNA-binding protein [Candidatus Sysuiplasma acidicola]MBX8636929.1 YhbY family RNA-binding protein [Candidatus Sysuiplasma acidicola]MBX8645227.1 YhbY family RNA-binding protein [Candidatus Sysuiplasma acidicola]